MNPLQSTFLLLLPTVFLILIGDLLYRSEGIVNLFSTYPPFKERIRRLIGRDLV